MYTFLQSSQRQSSFCASNLCINSSGAKIARMESANVSPVYRRARRRMHLACCASVALATATQTASDALRFGSHSDQTRSMSNARTVTSALPLALRYRIAKRFAKRTNLLVCGWVTHLVTTGYRRTLAYGMANSSLERLSNVPKRFRCKHVRTNASGLWLSNTEAKVISKVNHRGFVPRENTSRMNNDFFYIERRKSTPARPHLVRSRCGSFVEIAPPSKWNGLAMTASHELMSDIS